MMFELNLFNLVFVPLILLFLGLIYSRLNKPFEYRNISSHVPSITKTIWSEIKLTLRLGMQQPKGMSLHSDFR